MIGEKVRLANYLKPESRNRRHGKECAGADGSDPTDT